MVSPTRLCWRYHSLSLVQWSVSTGTREAILTNQGKACSIPNCYHHHLQNHFSKTVCIVLRENLCTLHPTCTRSKRCKKVQNVRLCQNRLNSTSLAHLVLIKVLCNRDFFKCKGDHLTLVSVYSPLSCTRTCKQVDSCIQVCCCR